MSEKISIAIKSLFAANDVNKYINRLFFLIQMSVFLLLFSNVLWGILFWNATKNADQKVFVRSGKEMFAALLADNDTRNIGQARGLITTFAHLFYDSDTKSFSERLNEGFWLLSKQDAQAIYKNFIDEKVQENYTKFNAYSKIKIDSIGIDMSVVPYRCTLLFQQAIYFNDQEKISPIGTIFELQPVPYSEKNPYGLQIQNFNYIEYQSNDTPTKQ